MRAMWRRPRTEELGTLPWFHVSTVERAANHSLLGHTRNTQKYTVVEEAGQNYSSPQSVRIIRRSAVPSGVILRLNSARSDSNTTAKSKTRLAV